MTVINSVAMELSNLKDNIESGRCIDGSPHDFIRTDGRQSEDTSGYGGYMRKDVFFCSKCLLLNVTVRRQHNETQYDAPPDWYTK